MKSGLITKNSNINFLKTVRSTVLIQPTTRTLFPLQNPTTRRSRVNTTFRKVRPKLRKTTRVAVDEGNLEAKKRIGSPVPMRNNFLDFSG